MTRSLLRIIIALFTIGGFYPSFAAQSNSGIEYNLAGEGQLVVFIHGSNLDLRMWAPQVERFSATTEVLAYDLRGLGASATPTQPYSDAADLAQLLEEIDETSAIIIGLSAGAQVALDFALLKPNHVEKLVLVSPSVNGYSPKENPPYLADLIQALREKNYEQANDVLLNSELLSVPSEYASLVRDMVTSSRQWELSYELVQQSSEPVLSNLNKVSVPTLILLGENDYSAITEIGNFLAQELPSAELVVLPQGRHLLNLNDPSRFNAVLENFILTDPR